MVVVAGLLVAITLSSPFPPPPVSDPSGGVVRADSSLPASIRNRIEAAAGLPERLVATGERLQVAAGLSEFYERRSHEPVWVTGVGLRPAARALLKALASSHRDGLRPDDYHGRALRRGIRRLDDGASSGEASSLGALVDVELLLTDAFLLYGTHLLVGHLEAATLHPNWRAERRERDLVRILERALEAGDPAGALADLRPAQPGYRRLVEALEAYRTIVAKGGWPTVPPGPTLAPNDSSDRIPALRERLAAVPAAVLGEEAYLGKTGEDAAADRSRVYDPSLVEAVRAFQRRHGLEPDGVVGPATLEALNVPASRRVLQLEVNLERWRWLPEELGRRHVLINAADFHLEAVEEGRPTLEMRVVVGRPYRQTPVFSDRITYMVFRPYWHVPHNLAVQDQLPLQQRDSGYFARLGFRVFRGWGADAVEVDPATVDWTALGPRNFPYRLRQDPGPQNFLGNVKFMFPNPWNVYLHDSPARELFGRTARSFSSGCIRVEKAEELARWLLRPGGGRAEEAVERGMRAAREETVRLANPVPVHLLYWTAFTAADGTVQFRPDIYGRDAPVARALERPPPGPEVPAEPPFGEETA